MECKRKDSRKEAQELSASVKSALEAYRKTKNQVKVLKYFIEDAAKPKSEKILSIDIDLRERLCEAIAPLKSELNRPLPMNTVSIGEYLKSCIGLVEINGQKKVRELESRIDIPFSDEIREASNFCGRNFDIVCNFACCTKSIGNP